MALVIIFIAWIQSTQQLSISTSIIIVIYIYIYSTCHTTCPLQCAVTALQK